MISARVGTLKRKQQVRQFLEAMPREDVEDVFSSAYMQNKRFEVCFFFFVSVFAKIRGFMRGLRLVIMTLFKVSDNGFPLCPSLWIDAVHVSE